jgi:hypothetical protein
MINNRKMAINTPRNGNYKLTIYSLDGKTIHAFNRRLSTGLNIIYVGNDKYQAGMYIASLKGTNGQIVKKIVLLK